MNPLFNFDSSENSFLLHAGVANICIEGKTYTGKGEAKLELLPKASIVFSGDFNDVEIHHILRKSEIQSFTLNQHSIDGFNTEGYLKDSIWKIKWIAKSEPVKLNLCPNDETKKIIFHLFNFEDFYGTSISVVTQGNTSKRISQFTLGWRAYQITIKSLFSTEDSVETLKNKGGYRLTQVGSIEKTDASSFSDDEQENLLEGLIYFLSFAKGFWCDPVCPVGLNISGEKIWYSLNSPDKQWQSQSAWFDIRHASQLEELFPLFMDLWEKDNWKTTIKEIIYWYLNANDPSRGTDAGLILTQAALERLSFEYVINEKKLLSSKGFKDIWASDKFRLLFSSLNIPIEIPSSLIGFTQNANNYKWIDAPHALTEIRNSLVHPEHKRHGRITTSLFFEAWNLSLWYLEMALLAICGYQGSYANRLISQRLIGTVEDVPWRKKELQKG